MEWTVSRWNCLKYKNDTNKKQQTKNKQKQKQKKQRTTPPLKNYKTLEFYEWYFFPWKIYGVSSNPFDIQRPGFYTDKF